MKHTLNGLLLAITLLGAPALAWAHFGVILPSDDIIEAGEGKRIILDVSFMHPFEGHYMQMERPRAFVVMTGGKKYDLLPILEEMKRGGFSTWRASYTVKRPGDHIFYVEPSPYWEPAEEKFIVHYTKVVVNAFGLQDAWEDSVGFPTEIIPLTRPYGIWAGNVFQGVVVVHGKPVPFADVEVEYYNTGGMKAPSSPYTTQLIKADRNGVFTYGIPRPGWWGFAALTDAEYTIELGGEKYPVELGAVLWIKAVEMRNR